MTKVIEIMEAQVASLKKYLDQLRDMYDANDANNPHAQVKIAMQIKTVVTEIESTENFIKTMKGEK